MTEYKDREKQTFLHGGDRKGAALRSGRTEEELLDFSANINPLGMPPGVREAVIGSLEAALHYPDPFCRELTGRIAAHTGHRAEQILCGNGGADLIYRLVWAVRPKRALLTAPAFAEYEEALTQAGAGIEFHFLGKSLAISEDYVDKLSDEHDLVFLCNPNNPTGLLTDRRLIEKLLERAARTGTTVCVDECFLDFVREQQAYSVERLLEAYPQLVILKSFTKLYAMPGLRLGYVLSSNEELLARMRLAGQPWAVSEPAQAAGIAALEAPGFREWTVELVEREREYLRQGLMELGMSVVDGQANYLCFQAPGDAALTERLLGEGVLLRSCANYRGLGPDYYRAAVRGREDNRRFLEALGKVCARQ